MLGTAASSITIRAGVPGRIEAVKSGAGSFFRSRSAIQALAIWRRLAARSCRRRACICREVNKSRIGKYRGLMLQTAQIRAARAAPIIFLSVTFLMMGYLLINRPVQSLAGVLVMLAGLIIY